MMMDVKTLLLWKSESSAVGPQEFLSSIILFCMNSTDANDI